MGTKTNKADRERKRRRKQDKGGSVLPILPGHQLTTEPCRDAIDTDFPAIRDMVATVLATSNGVGLAAPQIGCNARMFLLLNNGIPVVFINPQLIARSVEMQTDKEGCLSEPGRFVPIKRHLAVWVRWWDQDGKEHEKSFIKFPARIIQHEMDHLDGFCKVLTHEEK